jgi:hypothetical protein
LIIQSVYGQDSTLNYSSERKQTTLLVSAAAGSVLFFGSATYFIYYKTYEPGKFHFENDFKSFLQVDKLVHSYGSYVATNIWYSGLKEAGLPKKKALLWGGALGFIPLTPKEIFEGFSEPAGFSWGDILANAIGPAMFVSQELFFDEQILRYKSSFSRSVYARQSNGLLGKTAFESYFDDLNGHSYWLSFNASRIFPESKMPRWINLAAGYSANGMYGAYDNPSSYRDVPIPETQRYRQFLLSPDIDWSKIKTRSGFLKAAFYGLNFIKVPFPAIEISSKGQLHGYWLYF